MSKSFLDAVLSLAPFLDASSKGELAALRELLDLFPGQSLKSVAAEWKKYQKARLCSPEGFGDRIDAWRHGVGPDGSPREELAALRLDFLQMTATQIKAVGKRFEIAVGAKTDADVFFRWLETGIKPPTPQEQDRAQILERVEEARTLRDRALAELSDESISEIVALAERVKAEFKVAGLRVFAEEFGYPPPKPNASTAAVLKSLRQALDNLALARFKAAQIDSFGDREHAKDGNSLNVVTTKIGGTRR